MVAAAGLRLAVLAAAAAAAAAAAGAAGPAPPGRAGALLRLRGGMADEMAEIRAMRARQYAEQKAKEAAETAAEEQSHTGAQKVWTAVTEKLTAKTIQPKSAMSKGDARRCARRARPPALLWTLVCCGFSSCTSAPRGIRVSCVRRGARLCADRLSQR